MTSDTTLPSPLSNIRSKRAVHCRNLPARFSPYQLSQLPGRQQHCSHCRSGSDLFSWRIPKTDKQPSFQAFSKPDGTGKQRRLKLMPRESRPIMLRILEMNPSRRVFIGDILDYPWMKNLDHSTMEYMSPNHPHHLGDDGTVVSNPNEGIAVLPPSLHGSESGRSQSQTQSQKDGYGAGSRLAVTPAAV
ncbi:MAG: hypothetical protein J3R72DRAFT_514955 [Linnemannia gamsii]|nr:MAG: hypothetical protein J3R72DRAFT_514955 [Linnemannia gamsii]